MAELSTDLRKVYNDFNICECGMKEESIGEIPLSFTHKIELGQYPMSYDTQGTGNVQRNMK